MTVELCKNQECIKSPQGIIQIILITQGYLKYFIVILLILFYCCYFRRNIVLSENISETRKSETILFLQQHKTDTINGEVCPICMDASENEAVLLECGHLFHCECLKDWVMIKGSCPVCRKQLLD